MDAYRMGSWKEMKQEIDKELQDSYDQLVPTFNFINLDLDASQSILARMLDGDWPPQGGPGENYSREDFISHIRSSFKEKYLLHGDALLQHYGLPSPALDVTYELMSALWFATHPYKEDGTGFARHLEPTGASPGVIYVFDSTGKDLVDLRMVNEHPYDANGERIPYFGLRGVAQHGGLLLGATESAPDLSKRVVDEIEVHPDIWLTLTTDERDKWSYANMLPGPAHDLFYAYLLALKRRGTGPFADIVSAIREYK
jgi:hypothetical protein